MSNDAREMTCRQARRDIHHALDAREAASVQEELNAHLAACEACRTQHERLISVRGALPLDVVPEMTQAEWQRVLVTVVERLSHIRHRRLVPLVSAASLIVLCLAVALILLSPERESGSVLAGALDALDEIETAHGKGTHTVVYWAEGQGLREREEPIEIWYASGKGLRRETPTLMLLRGPEASVHYNKTQAAAVIETGTDEYGDSFMGSVLSTLYLSPDPAQPERHVTEAKAKLHGRTVDYVEISHDDPALPWSRWWVDPKSKLILREEGGDHPGSQPTHRTEYEYDVEVPDEIMRFSPPPGVKVTDLRAVPWQAAHEAADALPSHSITVWKPIMEGEPCQLGRIEVTETWAQGASGSMRQESSSCKEVIVSTAVGTWIADHEREGMHCSRLAPWIRLASRKVWSFEDLHCDEVELTRRESGGEEILEVSHVADEPSVSEMHRGKRAPLGRPWPFKTVTVFSVERKRLIERRKYMGEGDSWRWTETTVVDYPESLPDDIFQFARHWSRPKKPVWYPERRQECIDLLAED